ncbi:hypothetical protein GCM10010452_77180 [Crossiella cryophila]
MTGGAPPPCQLPSSPEWLRTDRMQAELDDLVVGNHSTYENTSEAEWRYWLETPLSLIGQTYKVSSNGFLFLADRLAAALNVAGPQGEES